jgi:hypothetical protein
MFPLDFRKRVVVVVNKWWECEPLMNVLLHAKARPTGLGWPDVLNHPRPRPGDRALPPGEPFVKPRAAWTLRNCIVEVWCLGDLMEHLPDQNQFQSSSARKVELLPRIFAGRTPALAIAMGTAGYPVSSETDPGINGGVVAGTGAFIHNYHPHGENPDSVWDNGTFDQVIASTLKPAAFAQFFPSDTSNITNRFVRPPNHAVDPVVRADAAFVAVGAVNVTNYADYAHCDQAALDAFGKVAKGATAPSVETTHGLIRLAAGDVPWMFISGMTDREGYFAQDVGNNEYAQNFAASHNMGVALAWVIPQIDAWAGA